MRRTSVSALMDSGPDAKRKTRWKRPVADDHAPEPTQPAQIPTAQGHDSLSVSPATGVSSPMTKCSQESRMRETCTSGSMRGSGRTALPNSASATLYSTGCSPWISTPETGQNPAKTTGEYRAIVGKFSPREVCTEPVLREIFHIQFLPNCDTR